MPPLLAKTMVQFLSTSYFVCDLSYHFSFSFLSRGPYPRPTSVLSKHPNTSDIAFSLLHHQSTALLFHVNPNRKLIGWHSSDRLWNGMWLGLSCKKGQYFYRPISQNTDWTVLPVNLKNRLQTGENYTRSVLYFTLNAPERRSETFFSY